MLRKLIDFLPLSRRKYAEGLMEIAKIINGLIEAEANHCLIETNLIQQLQKNEVAKTTTKKPVDSSKNDTNMYG